MFYEVVDLPLGTCTVDLVADRTKISASLSLERVVESVESDSRVSRRQSSVPRRSRAMARVK